jgi:hypothetical protein
VRILAARHGNYFVLDNAATIGSDAGALDHAVARAAVRGLQCWPSPPPIVTAGRLRWMKLLSIIYCLRLASTHSH